MNVSPACSWAPGRVVRSDSGVVASRPPSAEYRPIRAGAKADPRPSLRVTGWWMLLLLSLATAFGAEPRLVAETAPVIEPPKVTPPAPSPATPNGDNVIYPKNSPSRPKSADAERNEFPTTGLAVVLLLLAAGAYLVFKKGTFLSKPLGNSSSRLAIEETRPLGNKQFLAVATYGDRKLLIAVCPGKIDLLCRLDEDCVTTGADRKIAPLA